jgi:hypothetical protein
VCPYPCLHSLFGPSLFFPLSTAHSLISPPSSLLPYPPADAPRLNTMNAVHPYSDAQALVFSPQYTDTTQHHRSSFHSPMPTSPWSPPPTHSLMSSSQTDHARMYSLMHQPIHTIPSYSSTSPALFYNHHSHNNPQQHPRMQLSTPVPLNFSSPQIESSIGPHRGVLTRRQTRAAQLRGTPQPPTGQQDCTEPTSPSETQDVRGIGSILISLIFLSA